MESRLCRFLKKEFKIRDEDFAFYEKIGVLPPTLCPDERQRRRLTHRNLINLYSRPCDFSKKKIISNYSPDKAFTVYDQEIWWSDKWDPMTYGMDFDFTKPFFTQFQELQKNVPRPALLNRNSQNSQYTHHSDGNKNVYMGFNVGWCEDCMYITNYCLNSKDCVDCYAIDKCEKCYECVNTKNSFNSLYLILSSQCSDSAFLYDCRNCSHCFLCWNLRNKKYCILNQQYSKENYEKEIGKLWNNTHSKKLEIYQEFLAYINKNAIHRYAIIEHSENCTGDLIFNCKNVQDSYWAIESQDCRYCYDIGKLKDSYDSYEPYTGELQYECHACNKGYHLIGCSICYENNDLNYCEFCYNCSFLFGCIGLRHKNYCILNKQYTKEEYIDLSNRIIEHMKKTGEWGEFFPSALSPFAYNESVADQYFPLEKEEALKMGFRWKDIDKREFQKTTFNLQNEILACELCGRNYKILNQELVFYKEMKIPVPRECFFCRYRRRSNLYNPRKLWERNCKKCGAKLLSSIASDRQEIIYCEKCYLEAVY